MAANTIRDDHHWLKTVFTVSMGTDFASYKDMLKHSLSDETNSNSNTPTLPPEIEKMLNNAGLPDSALPAYFTRQKCRDTSIGGNDAINCYYQYNETDDVMRPFFKTAYGDSGMGRVYAETIEDNQQLMYITFGVPQFNNAVDFYKDAVNASLAKLVNTGETLNARDIGEIVGTGVTTFILLPVLPLIWLGKWLSGNLTGTKMTKYYDFKPTMPLYYRYVNSMLVHLSVNMGLITDSVIIGDKIGSQNNRNGQKTTASTAQEKRLGTNFESGQAGLPDIFAKWGPDIFRILCKKYMYMNNTDLSKINTSDYTLTKDMLSPIAEKRVLDETRLGVWDAFSTQFMNSIYEAERFVGFRVERSMDSSESLSNETGESELAKTINSKLSQIRDLKFNLMNGNTGNDTIDSIMSGLGGFLSGTAGALGISGISATLAGDGYIDIPEVWKNSSFSKSYSFNMSLRSPYGDPVSIMQSIYIPLVFLLAGSLPRAVGPTAYASPFVCRAYCKGMFSIPLGIIDSINIKRGSEQHGWNNDRLPTCVDVSFTIKDLSPAMYMAIGSDSNWSEVFGANSSFQEYLLTLSGVGTAERYSYLQNLRKKVAVNLGILSTTKLSPFYWGNRIGGGSLIGNAITAVTPVTLVPRN